MTNEIVEGFGAVGDVPGPGGLIFAKSTSAEIDDLKAKLAIAVEALEDISDTTASQGYEDMALCNCKDTAKAALQAIKGES